MKEQEGTTPPMPTPPSPLQLAAWRALWRKLLAPPTEEELAALEAKAKEEGKKEPLE